MILWLFGKDHGKQLSCLFYYPIWMCYHWHSNSYILNENHLELGLKIGFQLAYIVNTIQDFQGTRQTCHCTAITFFFASEYILSLYLHTVLKSILLLPIFKI